MEWLIDSYQKTTDKETFFNSFFTKLAGTKKLQQQIENNIKLEDIRGSWQVNLIKYNNMRQKYLLY